MTDQLSAAPTRRSERIFALDAIRGVAVLGILLMNILALGLPAPAYIVPDERAGGTGGANFWVWVVQCLTIEGTMRGLFTLLFGAGVALYTSRLERAGLGIRTADLYFRRNIWLIVLGLVNAYLLVWSGDILYYYGVVALFLFVCRNLSIKGLLRFAVPVLFLHALAGSLLYYSFGELETAAPELIALEEGGAELTREQEGKLEMYRSLLHGVQPDSAQVTRAVEAMRGDYFTALAHNAPQALRAQTTMFPLFMFWECLGMMLVGMALLKSGALTLGWSTRAYVILLAVGYGLGLTVNSLELRHMLRHDFAPKAVLLQWFATYDLGRIPMTLGHIALIMLGLKSGRLRAWFAPFAAAGRMALSNYLGQSLVCLFVFTGAGLGWYGQMQRYELYYVVAAVWIVQLVASVWWLARFEYGPMEWLWRSLTRWQRQPMRPTQEAAGE